MDSSASPPVRALARLTASSTTWMSDDWNALTAGKRERQVSPPPVRETLPGRRSSHEPSHTPRKGKQMTQEENTSLILSYLQKAHCRISSPWEPQSACSERLRTQSLPRAPRCHHCRPSTATQSRPWEWTAKKLVNHGGKTP